SRRKVEELIEQGRVEVDGQTVTDLACRVEPGAVKIKVDGSVLKKSRPIYYALNKPSGVLSTNYDPSGRMRVIDLVPGDNRVFSVGRLDQSSEGLMLLTNDGELAQRLAHPKFRIQKTYFVVVAGQMLNEELAKLRKGVHLAEGFARIDGATIKRHRKGCTEIEIVLSEGKNREIRRILARAGHKVVLLRRIAIGPLRLGQMPVGASRSLNSVEVKALYAATEPSKRPKKKPAGKKPAAVQGKGPAKAGASAAAATPSAMADDEWDDDDLLAAHFSDGDDDFVAHVDGAGGMGSVLSYDDEVTMPDSESTRRGPRGTPARGSRRNATRSAAASPGKARAPRGSAAKSSASRAKASKSSATKPRGSKAAGAKSPANRSPATKPAGTRSGAVRGKSAAGKKSGSTGQRSESRAAPAARSPKKRTSRPTSTMKKSRKR
ncbi:MAG: pseudouridine synthase, partial [Planctomycetales bacterium]|nr:pseudouridine synthase [Planctomycetales bacterium]